MKSVAMWVMLGLLLGTAVARADQVVLRDGTVKEGTVVSQGDEGVTLKIDWGGISSTVLIPTANVDHVEIRHANPTTKPAATRPTLSTPTATPAASQPTTRMAPAAPKKPGRLLQVMWQLATGRRADWGDPRTLDAPRALLWKKMVASDTSPPEETLATLLAFNEALQDQPGRADALSLRLKGELFGTWLANARWEVWKTHAPVGGAFDIKEITELETPALIGILRSHTAEALEPIKSYMPVPAAKTTGNGTSTSGGTRVRPADPVLGVTVDNAIDVKEKAAFAHAVLLAQLRLEPAMPTVDKVFLNQQLAEAQRVLARAADLEGKARTKLLRTNK